MNVDTVLNWINVANLGVPQAKALYDNLLTLFNEDDQAVLKDAVEDRLAQAEQSHVKRQDRLTDGA